MTGIEAAAGALTPAAPVADMVSEAPKDRLPLFIGITPLDFIFSSRSNTAFRYSASALTISYISLLRCLIFIILRSAGSISF